MLARWITNHDGKRRVEVEQVTERRKEELMDEVVLGDYPHPMRNGVVRQILKVLHRIRIGMYNRYFK